MQFKAIKRYVAILLIATILCSLFSSCAKKQPKPEDTIFLLQDAINNFDVETLLQCIDSEWATQIESLLSLSFGEDRITIGNFITLVRTIMPILPFVSDGAVSSDDLPEVEFTVLKTSISDQTATVVLSGILTWGRYTKPFAATVDMELENDVWVVCGVS